MIRMLLISLCLLPFACKENTTAADTKSDTTVTTAAATAPAFTWTPEDENLFLADCVENAKVSLAEDSAFMYCKCVLNQLRQKFPTYDSANAVLSDTARAAEFVKPCR
ncbi:MAG TPA: hypothetical protein VFZ78_10380 [Flavisolibacter sp.]